MSRKTVIAALLLAALFAAIVIAALVAMPEPTCSDHVPSFLKDTALDCSTQH